MDEKEKNNDIKKKKISLANVEERNHRKKNAPKKMYKKA